MEMDNDINKIVQQWAMDKFYSEQFLKYMKNKLRTLEVDVHWSAVTFTPGIPEYEENKMEPPGPSGSDGSELCSYKFQNVTNAEQEHSLSVEYTRTLRCVVRMTETSVFRWKVNLRLGLPSKVANTFCGGEFGNEMTVSSEGETFKEHVLKTQIDTTINVAQQSVVTAKLKEKKKEYTGKFRMPVWIKGQVPISIRRKGKRPELLHHCEANIFDVIKEQPNNAGFALDGDKKTVKYWIHGDCEFVEDMDLTFTLSQGAILVQNAVNNEGGD